MSNAFSAIPPHVVGVDAGASLCKVARNTQSLETRSFDSRDLLGVQLTLEEWTPERVMATGGGAASLAQSVQGAQLDQVPEFDAWRRGAPILADLEGLELPHSYLLVSLGTGTSILKVDGASSARVGGSGLGGGTLLGLGELLLGTGSFEEISALAARGDRRKVDLLVGDIYPEGLLPLPAKINAASFGKLSSREPEDLAHALVCLLGENLGLLCGQLGRALGVELVVYCGSTLIQNPALNEVLLAVTRAFGGSARLLERGAYCGAVGAASLAA